MIRKLLLFIFIFSSMISFVRADTNMDIIGKVILKKNNCLYIDKGRSDGVQIGNRIDILYDGRSFGNAIINWVNDDLSYARLDSSSFYRYYYTDPLEIKIYLEKPAKFAGGVIQVPYYDNLRLKPSELKYPDEMMVANLIYDGLVRLDDEGNIIAGLANSWEVHGNTYTFYLNSDVKFHSGKYLEAIDVAYSLVQLAKADYLTPASSFIVEIDGYDEVHSGKQNELRGIFIPNKHVIAITTKETFVPFFKYLAGPAGYIIPSSGMNPVPEGTGPFKIVSTNQNKIGLAANIEYFEGAPALDSIIFDHYSDRKDAALDFELGRLDLIYFDSEAERDLLTGGDYTSRRFYTNSSVMLGFNCAHNYEKDFEFVKALNYLFDKESIVRVILGNAAKVCETIVPKSLGIESPKISPYYFMPSEAESQIKQLTDLPPELNLVYDNSDPAMESVADFIGGQLRHIGLKVKTIKSENLNLEKSTILSTMDMYLFRYDLPVVDADGFFYPLFSERFNGKLNYLNYNEPQFEQLISGARALADDYARDDLYREAEAFLLNSPPVIPLYNPYLTVAYRRDLAGFEVDMRAFVDLRQTYFQAGKE